MTTLLPKKLRRKNSSAEEHPSRVHPYSRSQRDAMRVAASHMVALGNPSPAKDLGSVGGIDRDLSAYPSLQPIECGYEIKDDLLLEAGFSPNNCPLDKYVLNSNGFLINCPQIKDGVHIALFVGDYHHPVFAINFVNTINRKVYRVSIEFMIAVHKTTKARTVFSKGTLRISIPDMCNALGVSLSKETQQALHVVSQCPMITKFKWMARHRAYQLGLTKSSADVQKLWEETHKSRRSYLCKIKDEFLFPPEPIVNLLVEPPQSTPTVVLPKLTAEYLLRTGVSKDMLPYVAGAYFLSGTLLPYMTFADSSPLARVTTLSHDLHFVYIEYEGQSFECTNVRPQGPFDFLDTIKLFFKMLIGGATVVSAIGVYFFAKAFSASPILSIVGSVLCGLLATFGAYTILQDVDWRAVARILDELCTSCKAFLAVIFEYFGAEVPRLLSRPILPYDDDDLVLASFFEKKDYFGLAKYCQEHPFSIAVLDLLQDYARGFYRTYDRQRSGCYFQEDEFVVLPQFGLSRAQIELHNVRIVDQQFVTQFPFMDRAVFPGVQLGSRSGFRVLGTQVWGQHPSESIFGDLPFWNHNTPQLSRGEWNPEDATIVRRTFDWLFADCKIKQAAGCNAVVTIGLVQARILFMRDTDLKHVRGRLMMIEDETCRQYFCAFAHPEVLIAYLYAFVNENGEFDTRRPLGVPMGSVRELIAYETTCELPLKSHHRETVDETYEEAYQKATLVAEPLQEEPELQNWTKSMSNFSTWFSGIKHLGEVFTLFKFYVVHIANVINIKAGGSPFLVPDPALMDSMIAQGSALCAELSILNCGLSPADRDSKRKELLRIVNIVTQLSTTFDYKKEFESRIQHLVRNAENARSAAHTSAVIKAGKPQCVQSFITGPPGMGKNSSCRIIVRMVAQLLEGSGVPFNPTSFEKMYGEGFNDGYDDDGAIMIHDPLAIKTNERDMHEQSVQFCMAAGSDTTQLLSMSTTEGKGSTPNISALVFVTANQSFDEFAAPAKDQHAFRRRFQHIWECRVPPEFYDAEKHVLNLPEGEKLENVVFFQECGTSRCDMSPDQREALDTRKLSCIDVATILAQEAHAFWQRHLANIRPSDMTLRPLFKKEEQAAPVEQPKGSWLSQVLSFTLADFSGIRRQEPSAWSEGFDYDQVQFVEPPSAWNRFRTEHKVALIALSILGAANAIIGGYALYRTLRKPKPLDPIQFLDYQGSIGDSPNMSHRREVKMSQVETKAMKAERMSMMNQRGLGRGDAYAFMAVKQGGTTTVPTTPAVAELIFRNRVLLHSSTSSGFGIAIADHKILLNAHTCSRVLESDVFTLCHGEAEYIFERKDCRAVFWPLKDLCIIEVPRTIPAFKNILVHFMREELMPLYTGKVSRPANDLKSKVIENAPVLSLHSSVEIGGSEMHEVISTHMPNYSGCCGSVYYDTGHQKILGIHVAGSNESSFFSVISLDLIEDLLQSRSWEEALPPRITKHQLREWNLAQTPHKIEASLQGGAYEFVLQEDPLVSIQREATKQEKLSIPRNDLVPSPIAKHLQLNGVDLTSGPAVINSETYAKAFASDSCASDPIDFPPHLTAKYVKFYAHHLRMGNRSMQPFTLYEAINGRHGSLKALPTSSSLGPGYSKSESGAPLSWEDHFIPDPKHSHRWLPKPHIEVAVQQYFEALDRGENPSLYAALPKIEILSLDKIAAGKLRKFFADNIIGKLATRMLLGAAIDLHNNQRPLGNPNYVSCVGINLNGRDAQQLYQHHRSGALSFALDADVKKCDSSHREEHMNVISALTEAAYRKGTYFRFGNRKDELELLIKRIRQAFKILVHPIVIVGEFVYEYSKGMPSGNPATTYVNDLCISTTLRLSAALLVMDFMEEPQKFTFENLSKIFVSSHYGDDSIITWNPACSAISGSGLQVNMKRFGYTITPGDKSVEMPHHKEFEQCTFLKRAFTIEQMCVVMPTDLDSILQSFMWTTEKKHAFFSFPMTVRNGLLALSLHGREVYEKYAPIVLFACSKTNMSILELTFAEALEASGNVDCPVLMDS